MLVQETIWLGDTPIETIRPKTGGFEFFYVHTDHLNTPRRVSRPLDNQLRWRWDADPFGTAVPNENPAALGAFKYNLRYPGQYFDVESGLNYNYFRDYDAATGKYVQSDPVGLKAGVNTYAFAGDNPVGLVDFLGLKVLFCKRKALGAFAWVDVTHGYPWDTRNGKSCGAHGSNGRGRMEPQEAGPYTGCVH